MDKIEAIYPLTPLQQGMLFHSLYAPASGVYVEQLECLLRGPMNLAAFERAWQAAVDRNPILRTAFVWEELDEPVQVVHEAVPMSVDRFDWRDLPPEEQRAKLESFLDDDRRHGFDLAEAPLMRLVLIRLDATAWRFVWTHHHLLLDGWSVPLLMREFFSFYEKFCRGEEPELPRRRPYRDYIAWLRGQDLSKAEAFWRGSLSGFTSPTPIPVGLLAVPGADHEEEDERYEERQARLSAEATGSLQALARASRLTMNTLVQGAWAVLLSRYSGEEDVVFGVTVSGRPPELTGVEEMVGLFINTLPLRVRVTEREAVLPWLSALQERQVESRGFEYTPLSQVQGWSEVPRGRPLFDSILVFENYPMEEALLDRPGGLEIDAVRSIERTNYPITLAAVPGRELILEIGYDARRFDAGAIDRMLGHLQTLLEGIAANPEAKISELPVLTEADRRELLAWSRPDADDGEPREPAPAGGSADRARDNAGREGCLHGLFEGQVRRLPGAPAVEADDGSLTYEELNRKANRLARYLVERGVGVESRVGICLHRSALYVTAVLAALKAGACWVPLDPDLPDDRLAFMVEDAEVAIVLTDAALAGRLEGRAAAVVCLDRSEGASGSQPDDDPPCSAGPANLAYIIYTSGSTGRPKGVMVHHGAICSRLRWGQRALPLDESDRLLQKTSIGFDVSVWEIFTALTSGARLVVAPAGEQQDTERLAERITRRGVTIVDFVPSMLRWLLDEAALEGCRLRRVSCGGEAMPADLPRRFFGRLSAQLHNFYGPTETAVDATFRRCGPEDSKRRGIVPIGRPIGSARVYILDHALRVVPAGVPGELCVGGDCVARGYLRRPDLTAEQFIPDAFALEPSADADGAAGGRLYRTGDLVCFLPDGNLEFLGRIDRQVKVRGNRIEPGEIETALREHDSIAEAVVALREDQPGERRLVAYFVTRPRTSPSELSQEGTAEPLRGFLKTKLPEWMIPSAFVPLAAIPRTPSGKLDLAALPRPGVPLARTLFAAPRGSTEEVLAEVWAQVLGVERVGIHDNFFELGGDSILSIQLVSKARERGIRITPRQLFQHQTVSELAAAAGETGEVSSAGASVTEEDERDATGEAPLTPIQRWFFEQELPEPHHWNQAVLLETRQALDEAVLQKTLEHLTLHHDALRLRYRRGPSGWIQSHALGGPHVAFERVDLSSLRASGQTSAIEEAAARAQRGCDIVRGPLVRGVLFDLGTGRLGRLLIVVHHLVVDGVSWRILLEDFQTAYEHLLEGARPVLPPKTTSFGRWAGCLADQARSRALGAEAVHWLAVAQSSGPPLPADGDGENLESSASSIEASLDRAETLALLQEVPAAYRTEINDVLLTALLQAFERWTGRRDLLVDLEGHGREAILEELDLSRTVGWFTTVFPVRLALPAGAAGSRPGDALKAVKEQLRAVPGRGIGYGLLRYMGGDPEVARKLAEGEQAEVSFNYMGQLDRTVGETSAFGWAAESAGPSHGPHGRRSHAIEVNAQVAEGRLEVEWTFSENRHRRSTIESVARDYIEALRRLIEHCRARGVAGFTPSDFPQAGLSQKQLDELLARLGDAGEQGPES